MVGSDGVADSRGWSDVYHRYLTLNINMLNTLKYNFLQDALNFVGVHQDRMQQVGKTSFFPLILIKVLEFPTHLEIFFIRLISIEARW